MLMSITLILMKNFKYKKKKRGPLHPHRFLFKILILFFLCLACMGEYYLYSTVPALASSFTEELGLSQQKMQFLFSMWGTPNIVLVFFGGIFVDYAGARTSIIIFCVLMSLSSLITALFHDSYAGLLAARALGGIAAGSLYTAIDSLIVKWFKGKAISLALGISESSARLAEIIGFITLARIAASTTFQFSLWTGAFVSLAVLLSSLLLFGLDSFGTSQIAQTTGSDEHHAHCPKPSDLKLFKKEYFILVFIVATYYGTLYVFVSNCSQLLQYKFDYDEVEADGYFTFMTLTGAIISPFIGAYLDKKGQRGIILSIGLLLILTGYLSIVYVPIFPVISIMVAGVGDAFTANCVLSLLSLIVPEEKYATGYGFMASLYFITQSLLFYVVGILNNNQSSREIVKSNLELSITVLAFVLAIGFFVSVFFNLYDYRSNKSLYNLPSTGHNQKLFNEKFSFIDYQNKDSNSPVSTYM